MHPDGDEVLFLISGRLDVVLEEDDTQGVVEMTPGQALIVPKGVWHRVLPREPSQLLHITPGPGGEWRPLKNSVPGQVTRLTPSSNSLASTSPARRVNSIGGSAE